MKEASGIAKFHTWSLRASIMSPLSNAAFNFARITPWYEFMMVSPIPWRIIKILSIKRSNGGHMTGHTSIYLWTGPASTFHHCPGWPECQDDWPEEYSCWGRWVMCVWHHASWECVPWPDWKTCPSHLGITSREELKSKAVKGWGKTYIRFLCRNWCRKGKMEDLVQPKPLQPCNRHSNLQSRGECVKCEFPFRVRLWQLKGCYQWSLACSRWVPHTQWHQLQSCQHVWP